MPPRADASRSQRFRYEYGAEPLHLLATVASLAVALYAILRIFEIPNTAGILLWLAAAIVAHDFIAMPLYSALLRVAEETTEATVRPRRLGLLALNHVRIPVAFSLLLLLLSFPLIFQIDETRYELTTGLDLDRYLGNWLLITAALFAGSGLLYALKLRRRGARAPIIGRGARQLPAPEPSRAATLAARLVLAVGAVFAAWVLALAVYGVLAAFPL